MTVSPGFTILDRDEAFSADPQSVWMQTDIDAIINGIRGSAAVIDGCAVSAAVGMDLNIAAGNIFSGSRQAYAGGVVTIGAADITNPRIDVVVIDSAGADQVRAGVAAEHPKMPQVTAGDVVIAAVLVPANETDISGNFADLVTDKRVLVADVAAAYNIETDFASQYAFLAGRATGQYLRGGTGSGENLRLESTAHGTKGHVYLGSSSLFDMEESTGQLKLPTTGVNAGLLVGGDVQIYRVAADVWATPDSMRVAGYVNVGSVSAPTNALAGDLTADRFMFGTEVDLAGLSNPGGAITDVLGAVSQTLTPTSNNTTMFSLDQTVAPDATAAGSGAHQAFGAYMKIRPSAASAHRHVAFDLRMEHDAGAFNLSAATGMVAVNALVHQNVAASTVTAAGGGRFAVGAVAGTITTSEILGVYYGKDGSDAGTIVDEHGIRFTSNAIPTGGVTRRTALSIRGQNSGTGIGTYAGIRVETLVSADVNTYAAHFGDNRVAIGGDWAATDGADGHTAISRLMPGIELMADELNTTNMHTAAVKFMSTDSSFTTENPKLLAAIAATALETYNADTRGIASLDFYATSTSGATQVPTHGLSVRGDGIRVPGYLVVGQTGAMGSNVRAAQFSATLTDTAAGAVLAVNFAPTYSPASASSSEFRTVNISGVLSPATTITMTTVFATYFELENRSDAAITTLVGAVSRPVTLRSSSPATVGTVTNAYGFEAIMYQRPSGTSVVTLTNVVAFRATGPTNAGATVTTYTAFQATDPGASFAPTTVIGLDIAQLTRGTTNIGIRNASPTAFTPSTAQNITAAGTTLLANATVIQLTADNNYTLSSTPTIADGVDGQILIIVNVDAVDTITLQDQGTLASSNLRLAATTVALGPRGSIKLMFSSTVGDWIQIGQTNVL